MAFKSYLSYILTKEVQMFYFLKRNQMLVTMID